MKKKLFTLFFILTFIFSMIPANAIDLTATSAIVMDVSSGASYYEKNADVPLAPASMTKVMTVYMIYECISNGTLSKDTLITADAGDYEASVDSVATNVRLEQGKQYSVDDLIGAILVPSACAASAMVGKYIAGSEREFAALMTQTAESLGLEAYYEDASGLSDNNRITARSMAKLVSLMVTKYPDVLNYTSKPKIVFDGKTYKSTNRMLASGSMPYPGVDGFKTGTTTLAGCCFASSALLNDTRLVSVTMHSDYGSSRFDDTKKMLDLGFSEAEARYNNLYSTALRVYINGHEVPAFYYMGKSNYLAVIAEDLANYGFDIEWDNEAKRLTAGFDADKTSEPMNMDVYRGYEPGKPLLPIYNFEHSVQINYKDNSYTLNNTHNLNGYIAVSADELSIIAKESLWDNETRSLYLSF